MAIRLKPLDLSKVQTGSVRRRDFLLGRGHLAVMPDPNESLQQFYHAIPKVGEALHLLDAAELLTQAALDDKPIVWIVDGGLMNVGLAPLVLHLMRRGLVACLVLNGEAAVRDYELACHGATCEDPAKGLADGLLGLARETGESINTILNEGVRRGFSIGECLGRGILERQPKFFSGSLLATSAARLIPATVHIGMGADGFHHYPGADGAMLGKGSLKDSHLLSSLLSQLPKGTLVVSTHHGEMLNQVFLHAFALARNMNPALQGFHLLRLGTPKPSLSDLPGLDRIHRLAGPLEINFPLLLGALFSLVE